MSDVTFRSESGRPCTFPEARYGMSIYAMSNAGSSVGSPVSSNTSPMEATPQEFQSVASPHNVVPSIPSSVEQYNVLATDPTNDDVLMQPGATTSATEEAISGLVKDLLADYNWDLLDGMTGDLLNNNSLNEFPTTSSSSSPMANGT